MTHKWERLLHSRCHETRYVVDARHMGGVGRFLNHSCNPNCFVQPVLAQHADVLQPTICFFASANIPPFTELTCVPSCIEWQLDA